MTTVDLTRAELEAVLQVVTWADDQIHDDPSGTYADDLGLDVADLSTASQKVQAALVAMGARDHVDPGLPGPPRVAADDETDHDERNPTTEGGPR